MWILLFLLKSPKAVKQYTSGTFMWKHQHHHHHHHHYHNDYYYYHLRINSQINRQTREQQWEVNETTDLDSKELKVIFAKCFGLLPVVLVLRIWSCLRRWLHKQHIANDNVQRTIYRMPRTMDITTTFGCVQLTYYSWDYSVVGLVPRESPNKESKRIAGRDCTGRMSFVSYRCKSTKHTEQPERLITSIHCRNCVRLKNHVYTDFNTGGSVSIN